MHDTYVSFHVWPLMVLSEQYLNISPLMTFSTIKPKYLAPQVCQPDHQITENKVNTTAKLRTRYKQMNAYPSPN